MDESARPAAPRGAAAEPLAGASGQTLHTRIRTDLEQQILNGAWPPGFRIPFEPELMKTYGCSRMTVYKAITSLVEAGLVYRRKGSGTFVATPHVQSVVLDVPDIAAAIRDRHHAYGYQLLSRHVRVPNKRLPEELSLAAGGELLHLVGLHEADERPFAVEERLISLNAVPQARRVDFTEIGPGTWLLGHVPWSEAEHRIKAINPSAELADLLQIDVATACLAIERETWRAGERITHVRQVFPGELYDLMARFGPSHA